MAVALLMGRKGSEGFPGKNLMLVLGKPLMCYPLDAAVNAKHIEKVFVSTDDPAIKDISLKRGAVIIDRPAELCTTQALGEDVYVHGLNWIRKNYSAKVDMVALLMCNAATITSTLIDEGIEVLLENKDIDSAVSVSHYNMWSPLRARKEDARGLLKPFVPFEVFGDVKKLSCDRDSQGDVWFADMGVSVVRARCLDQIEEGLLPQKWMGKNIYPLKQWGGFDVDYEWQIPMLEYWLKKIIYKEDLASQKK
jgi:GTP:adenosylcobinamide-phosphate guanylyltransferase